MLNFKNLAVVSAAICLALCLTWMFAAPWLLSLWGIPYSEAVGVVGRRNAALFAGVAVMLYCARNAQPSSSRFAMSVGFIVSCVLLAGLGLFELFSARAGAWILLAVVAEIALALGWAYVERQA